MVFQHEDGSVEFAFFRPGAGTVELHGCLADQQPAVHDMQRDDAGWWRCRMDVAPGEYRFHYCVDGKLNEADFAAYGVERTRDGQWVSMLWVRPAASAAQQRRAA